MPPWGPVSRRKLITSLRRLDFTGPYSGGRHQFMARGDLVLTMATSASAFLRSSCARLASPEPRGTPRSLPVTPPRKTRVCSVRCEPVQPACPSSVGPQQ
jgi:hypothetical protein